MERANNEKPNDRKPGHPKDRRRNKELMPPKRGVKEQDVKKQAEDVEKQAEAVESLPEVVAGPSGHQPEAEAVSAGQQPEEATNLSDDQQEIAQDLRDPPIVEISHGKVKGRYVSILYDSDYTGEFCSFVNIPIASINKRFELAKEIDKWEDIKDCSMYNEKAKIRETRQVHVNVYTKKLDKQKSVPVMVFVPGENSMSGNYYPSTFYGPQYLLREDVVVVVAGYRTGIFGSLKWNQSRGDHGLIDLMMCLIWVTEEIHNFGGNPDNITCFGQGEGAAALWAISLRNFEPQIYRDKFGTGSQDTNQGRHQGPRRHRTGAVRTPKKQLYHKLILQSSTALCRQWTTRKMTAKEFCHLTGHGENLGDYTAELQNMDFKSLDELEKKLPKKPVHRMIDYGKMLLMEENPFKYKVPVLIGFNSNEYFYDKSIYDDIDKKMDSILDTMGHHDINDQNDVPFYDGLRREDFEQIIRGRFYDGQAPTLEKFKQVTQDLHHNINILIQAKDLASIFASGAKEVYLYKFDGSTELNLYKRRQMKNSTEPGAAYGDELGYLFKTPFPIRKEGAREKEMRHAMVTIWTNFAKFGRPLPPNDTNNPKNNLLDFDGTWECIKTKRFHDRTNIKEYVVSAMNAGVIRNCSLEYQNIPEVERMDIWWRGILGGLNWMEE